MGKTIIEKIIGGHAGKEVSAGDRVWANIDLAVIRDFGGPNVVLEFDEATNKGKVWDPGKIAITFDYQAPAKVAKVAENQRICRDFAIRQGIENLFEVNCGVGQHTLLEHGMILPGSIVVGTDSHMNLLGAVGCYATGMGTTDIAAAFAAGRLWFRVPPSVKVIFEGGFTYPATAKDLTLEFVRVMGADGSLFRSVEFEGDMIDNLPLSGRLTLASMVTETSGEISFFPLSGEIAAFLEKRSGRKIEPVISDPGAVYEKEIVINIEGLRPKIACPHTPDNVKDVREVEGVEVDEVFIGSCTNGSFEDLKAAAEVMKGKKVHPRVRTIVTPATSEVALKALKDGLYEIFMEAGAMVTNPGCALCTIGHPGILGEREVAVSTGNRNFIGKIGKGAEVYLASPVTAALTAIEGKITDPARVLSKV
ncbi:MAG: aconitase/3-isopropylmalate dehydratase large subunit family protein [Chloroflexi bacterium]|nr:aconitase/3-isopropylmalate dehydratase large subunit family protein [Chloroflexota bacterium]